MRMALPWNLGEFEFAKASIASATMAALIRTVAVDQAISAGPGGAVGAGGVPGSVGAPVIASVFGASVMPALWFLVQQ
jgi:hypothetical protein